MRFEQAWQYAPPGRQGWDAAYSGKSAATAKTIAGNASALTFSPPERVKLVL